MKPFGINDVLDSYVRLLRQRADTQGERCDYLFLPDDETEVLSLTYAQLDLQARRIAARLQALNAVGERALLLYPPGFDYIAAFFGCLYAGVVAVPAYPPRLNHPTPRLQAIVKDAQAIFTLTTSAILSNMEQRKDHLPDSSHLRWLATDVIENDWASLWREPEITGDSLAFLQYTSGSTATPRGVMVSHANLLQNASLTSRFFQVKPEDVGVIWLPPYHDMGLIGGILQPLYDNIPVVLMPPVAFLQRPLRWLQTISQYGATISGGPDFAYDLCVKKITPEQCEHLDLQRWSLAFNGAEPVQWETMQRFAEKFAPFGFRKEAFYPCYGMAETTLIVSGGQRHALPVACSVQQAALAEKRIVSVAEGGVTFVGCGQTQPDQKVLIVDPETSLTCPPNRVGEIWVAAPNVAQGYWNQPESTTRTFAAYLADTGKGPFLRTGDLGFWHGQELVVAGRLKDLIIIRGRNYYPQDIEFTVSRCHPGLNEGWGATFTIEVNGSEQLVVTYEIKRLYRKANTDEILHAVRQAVAEQYDLQLYAVVLLRPGSIPKTSSGKIRRYACRRDFLTGELKIEAIWQQSREDVSAVKGVDETAVSTPPSTAGHDVQNWLLTHLAGELQMSPTEIDVQKPFSYYGIDSVKAVGFSGVLQERFKRPLSPTLLYDYPTIHALAQFLAEGEKPPVVEKADARPVTAEPIAIVGIGCRFPGAENPAAFWQLLRNGEDAISEVPPERWAAAEFYNEDTAVPGKMNTRWGGFLEQIDLFDTEFFGIAPREASRMDPQQRLLLEVTWEALVDGGQAPGSLAGQPVGIFVGIANDEYSHLQMRDVRQIDAYAGTGNARSIAANRLSYFFDFRGPSVAIDTACSSSLVAVHLACQSIWTGESTLALAGGVNLILKPDVAINFTKARVMAADGRCKTFDSRADGYVRAEGAGMVVLKPLAVAQADGDPIYAVILGSAVNQDGRTNGLMAPNRQAQEAVLRAAYQHANVSVTDVQYIEAHGTGTLLGDSVEVQALASVVGAGRPLSQPCRIGSVKTNIGHLEAAAGIAGLIKVVLSLKYRELPPNLHYETPSPYIQFANLPLAVQENLTPWPNIERLALAGVSSFGFGGTNAHVVLQAASLANADFHRELETGKSHLLPVSAHNKAALHELMQTYRDWLPAAVSDPAITLTDICATAARRRTHHRIRVAVAGHDVGQLVQRLDNMLIGEAIEEGELLPPKTQPRAVFVFPGQGSQWLGMGRNLLRQEPVFQATIAQCEAAMEPYVDWSLVEQLTVAESDARLHELGVIQPVLFAIQVGLAALWRSWGIKPAAVVGHSMGEVAAAYVAGALTLADAVRIICQRSQLLQRISGQGGMALVALSLTQAQTLLTKEAAQQVAIAANNSPDMTVLSGDKAMLSSIVSQLQAQGIFCRLIKVDVASHSQYVDRLQNDLLSLLADVQPRATAVPMYSTVTNNVVEGLALTADYWVQNLRQPVLFAPVVQTLLSEGIDAFIEISPHPVLLSSIQEMQRTVQSKALTLPSLRRAENEITVLLSSLAALYAAGHEIIWSAIYPDKSHPVRLPTYPWQRSRHWFEDKRDDEGDGVTQSESSHPLLGQRLTLADPPGALVWQRELNRRRLPYLDDHQVQGTSLLPAAAYIEMALAAARELWGEGIYTVTTLSIGKGLFLPETSLPIVQVIFQLDGPAEASVRIYSQMAETDSWTLHASGVVRQEQVATDELQLPHDVETETHTYTEIDVVEYYAALRQQGLQYGDAFQALARLWQGQGRAVGLVRPASAVAATDLYHLHPVLLDACCQVLGAAAQTHMNGNGRSTLYLPYYFERVRVYGRINDHIWSRASLQPTAPADEVHGDILLRDDTGQLIAEIQGLRLKRLDKVVAGENENDWLYQLIWSPQARIAATAVTQPSTWIIVSGSRALPSRISDLFEQAGHHAVLIPGETVRHNGKSEHALTRAKIWQQLVKQPFTVQGIVYLGETSHIRLAKTAPDEAALQRVMELLHLVQALAQLSHPPRLWIVTTGAQVVASSPTVPNIAQTPLWGMGRTLQHEHPEMACTLIDLSQHPTAAELDELLQELQEPSSDQVALRTGMRYLPRLQRFTPRSTTQSVISIKDDMAFHLAIDEPGTLTNLHLRALQARSPEPDEVEIEVQAAGLNFADVMKALGVAPGIEGAPILGVECAGWITAVGSNITNFSVGDAVVAIAPNCLGNRVITPACLVTPKPDRLSFVDAATIPIAFITAYYALCQLGQLQAGERVLIHAATGGVGQAAVQIAQWRGAEIFATAGSPAKRDFLRSLGIQQVMDSRSLAFADEIRGQTNGLGVNVVLNSLAGTALRASLDVLGCYGRFLEIGKRDIYAAADLGLAPFRRNLTFAAIDLERMVKERPQQVGELLQTVMTHVRSGEWQPLPAQLFPITEAASAFRIMARAQHMGKIVLSSQVAPGISVRATKAVTISADVSYLITGGWGALGLTVVDWLVEMGARHLVLVGRSEPGETAVTQIKSWQATGVQIILKQANVTKLHQMQQILKEVSDTMPPLRGVVHAAGVLNDGTLQHLEPAQVAAVFAPKVAGAWHLHQLTADLELDFFLLFSSAASLLGSPGQGNYAAANMFMDGLAQLRNAQGLPGLSINWGPWADIGLAARADRVGRLDKQGVGAIKPAQGKAILSRLWAQRVAQVGVIPFDWDKMKVMTGGSWSILKDVMDISASRANPSARITLLSLEPDARLSWLITHLRRQVAQVLGATAVNLDEQQPLTNLGLDSLMAVELKNRIERDLGVSLPMVTFLQGPTLPQMAENLLLELSMDDPPEKEPLPVHLSDLTVEELATQVDEATLMAQLEQLSDDDVELLLGQMLSDE